MPTTKRTENQPRVGTAPRAYLDIRLEDGPSLRRPLVESHAVIGRIEGVQVLLDHHTVSRRHAEMFCDPFGRWWIRDLASTNGTMVGGEFIEERVLSPGDRIAVGDYNILFGVERESGAPESFDLGAYENPQPTILRRMDELEAPRIAAGHLRTLLAFSRRLIDIDDADERVEALRDLVLGTEFSGTLAMVLRIRGNRSAVLKWPRRPDKQLVDGRPYISRSVLEAVRETRQPVLGTNVDTGADTTGPEVSVEISMARGMMELWVIACPIRLDGDDIDVLYAHVPPSLGSAEWVSLYALAAEVYQQGEAAWRARRYAQEHAAIERELATARQIQRGLLPRQPSAPGLDVAVGFEPCKWVGGDYVDVVHLSDGRVLLAVADVCGKGLQAALVGSSLHTMVRAASDNCPPLVELVERVNRHLCDWLPADSFVTMVVVVIHPGTGLLECVNAGHPPPLIVDRRGALRSLQESENPALGIAPTSMTSERGRLEVGEMLAMYTDGLTELRNVQREMLGQDQLGAQLTRLCARAPAAAAVSAALLSFLEEFRGEELPEDDRTFLLARKT